MHRFPQAPPHGDGAPGRRGWLTVAATVLLMALPVLAAPAWATELRAGVRTAGGSTGRDAIARASGPRVLVPAAESVLIAGQHVTIRWSPPPAGTRELEILLVAGGLTLRVTDELDPKLTSFSWTVPHLPAANAVLEMRFNRGDGEEIASRGASFHIVGVTSAPRAHARFLAGEWWLQAAPKDGDPPLSRSFEKICRTVLPNGLLLAMAPERRRDAPAPPAIAGDTRARRRAAGPTHREGADAERQAIPCPLRE